MPTDPCPSQECALTSILTSTACLDSLGAVLVGGDGCRSGGGGDEDSSCCFLC